MSEDNLEKTGKEPEEKEKQSVEKKSWGEYMWFMLYPSFLIGLSFFIAFWLKQANLYLLLVLWALTLYCVIRFAFCNGFKRFLSWLILAVAVLFCAESLTYAFGLARARSEARRIIAEAEALKNAPDEAPAEEEGSAAAAAGKEASSEEEEKPVYDWDKHYAYKNEYESSLRKGLFTLYEYTFSGEGEKHTKEEIKLFNISTYNSVYPKIDVECRIEWPNEDCGLTAAALAKVRRAILWASFSQVVPFGYIPYERLKGLGETPESILAYKGMDGTNSSWNLDYYIGDSVEDCFLSNSGNYALESFILSHKAGKIPAREGDVVGDDCLEFSLDFLKEYTHECYECDLEEYHICSQYTFDAKVTLSWPFGLKAKEGTKWYEKPVLCVRHWGYANDGGNGDHSFLNHKIYSLPDGEELFLRDYFAEDKLEALTAFVKQRLIKDWLNNEEEGINLLEKNGFELDKGYVNILVNEKGMEFQWPVYAILPRPYAAPEIFIEWEELEPFKK